jgi:hypothetical protein
MMKKIVQGYINAFKKVIENYKALLEALLNE